jgi:hypothetical protein
MNLQAQRTQGDAPMITYTTDAIQTYLDANDKVNEANREAKWAPITSADDPRIELTKRCNDALVALTEQEYAVIEDMRS